MNSYRMERAKANIEYRLNEEWAAGEYAADIRSLIERKEAKITDALSTPARKRAEREFGRLLLELEEETFQFHCADARAKDDAERTAAALSRGTDYWSKQRAADRARFYCPD